MAKVILKLALVTVATVVAVIAALSAYAAHVVQRGSWRYHMDPYDMGD